MLWWVYPQKTKKGLSKKLGITEEQYNGAVSDLTKLNPRPGSSLGEAMGKKYATDHSRLHL